MAAISTEPDVGKTPMEEVTPTVTLTNWKRLANTTVVFTADAQAVVWKDYIVVLDGIAETLHFYHLKHRLWSTVSANIPSYSEDLSVGCVGPMCGHALAAHNASLVILSTSGYVYEFSENKWILHHMLPVQFYNSCGIFTSISLRDDKLDSLVLLEAQDGQSLHTFRYNLLLNGLNQKHYRKVYHIVKKHTEAHGIAPLQPQKE